MPESNEAAQIEAQLQVVMRQHELDLITEIESGLGRLREKLGSAFIPGLMVAEDFCHQMRERQP